MIVERIEAELSQSELVDEIRADLLREGLTPLAAERAAPAVLAMHQVKEWHESGAISDYQAAAFWREVRKAILELDPPEATWHHGFEYSIPVLLICARFNGSRDRMACALMNYASEREHRMLARSGGYPEFLESIGVLTWTGKTPHFNLKPRLPDNQHHEPFVYLIENQSTELVKIGVTTNIYRRLSQLQTATGCYLEVIGLRFGGRDVESELHKRFAEYRVQGEWFHAAEPIINFAYEDLAPEGID